MIQLRMTESQRIALAQRLRADHPLIAREVERGQLIPEDAEFLRGILLKAPSDWLEGDILRQLCSHKNLKRGEPCPDCGYEYAY